MVKKKSVASLQVDAIRITRTTFFAVALFMLVTALFDSGNLITRESVAQRWVAGTLLLFATLSVWFLVRTSESITRNMTLLFALAVCEVIFAGFMIYWERGMASTSTLLLALPIITVGVMRRRVLLLLITTLTAATYSLSAVKYFNDFFNEGYRIQLWGNVVFYSGLCFILAWMVLILVGLRHDSK